MWVRILKTNRGEIHAVVQTPKVLNSFINDLWTLKKVHCIDSYEHTFKLLEAVKQATFEHKIDRIIIPLRNPYDRFWDGITVNVYDISPAMDRDHCIKISELIGELVITSKNPIVHEKLADDHYAPYLTDDFVDWITKGDILYTTFDVDSGPDYMLYWDHHHGIDQPPWPNKSDTFRKSIREALVDKGSSSFSKEYKEYFIPINENMKKLRNGSTPLL